MLYIYFCFLQLIRYFLIDPITNSEKVLYDPPRNPGHVLSQVRYVGCVPEMAPNGHLLGLEVIEPGWFQGRDGRQYFDCDTGDNLRHLSLSYEITILNEFECLLAIL